MTALTALVIGFGPFPGVPVNPSAVLVRALGRMRRPALADTRIVTIVLPTSYTAVEWELPGLIHQHDPDIVLLFGVAGRAKRVRIETQAANARSVLHPDANAGVPTLRISSSGADRLRAAAPFPSLLAAARLAGVNAELSHNAGRYICNASLYTCLDLRRSNGRPERVAFVHIPRPRRPDARRNAANRRRPAPRMLQAAGAAILLQLVSAARRG